VRDAGQQMQVVVDDRGVYRNAGRVDDARVRHSKQQQQAQQAFLVVRNALHLGHDVGVETEARHDDDRPRGEAIGEDAPVERSKALLQLGEPAALVLRSRFRMAHRRGRRPCRRSNCRIEPETANLTMQAR